LAVIKAKQSLKAEPNWLDDNTVLDLQSPRSSETVDSEFRMDDYQRDKRLMKALQYQLQERLMFVAAPDPIVADLLVDYGLLMLKHNTKAEAKHLLAIAEKFGADREEFDDSISMVEQKGRELDELKKWENVKFGFTISLLFLAGLVVAFFLMRKRWRKSKN
jgi:hypothetical protein